MPGAPVTRTSQISKWAGYVALTVASLWIILNEGGAFYLSRELYRRNIVDASAKNSRGDKVFAETDVGGGSTHPWHTVIRLKRAYHPFSTTLLEAYSYDVLVGLKWRDDDDLLLQLDFGCDGHNTEPVARVGPIRILYDFGDLSHVKIGYETAPRPDPSVPCD